VLGEEYLDVLTVPLRDIACNTNLHYVLRLKKPEDFTVGQSAKGSYFYSILTTVRVYGSDGKLIFSEEKKISRNISTEQYEQIKGKLFGYEGWLPLPPNKYKLDFQLTNLLGNTTFRRTVDVVIPDQAGTLQASNLVPFAEAAMTPPEANGILPFSGAGVKFIPMAGQELQLVQGQQLKFFYQVWMPVTGGSRAGKKLEVDYVYGRLGAQDNKTIHDEIPLEQLDAGGSVINGKQIGTAELQPGNYRLVMTLRDPETGGKAYGGLSFGVYTSTSTAPAFDVSDDKLADSINAGTTDYQRALCYVARGDKARATEWLEKAHAKNSKDEHFRNTLIELYFDQQKYEKVVELYAASGLNDSTDEQTIVRIAESFDKRGDLRKAVGVMESGTILKPGSAPLLLGLAEYYRKSGDLQKAAAAEQKRKQLMSAHPES
jgi:tetratricopeptide (TPR) repeat protein